MSERVSLEPRGSERLPVGRQGLSERRRLRRRRVIIVLTILIFVCLGAVAHGLGQSAVRISRIDVFGADATLAAYATSAMQGWYGGIIPRDSTFFLPAARIRAGILAAHPDIAAVSIFRNGLTGLSIRVDNRVPIARWCGTPSDASFGISTSTPLGKDCYFFDASGVIYATTSTAQPLNSFTVYQSFANEDGLIGSTLPNIGTFSAAFDFARQLETFGSSVSSIVFRNDEVDEYLQSGTRVTYVLGNEQNASTALVSARANLNLANGSIEYIDLRFDGKVYVKKRSDKVQ